VSRHPPVVVMQATDDRECHDTTVSLGHSRQRLFLPEALVWPRLVVEAGVLRDEAQKMENTTGRPCAAARNAIWLTRMVFPPPGLPVTISVWRLESRRPAGGPGSGCRSRRSCSRPGPWPLPVPDSPERGPPCTLASHRKLGRRRQRLPPPATARMASQTCRTHVPRELNAVSQKLSHGTFSALDGTLRLQFSDLRAIPGE